MVSQPEKGQEPQQIKAEDLNNPLGRILASALRQGLDAVAGKRRRPKRCRYNGEKLRQLRAERGVGNPKHLVRS